MRRVYHLVPRSVWEAQVGQPYRAASLDTEGFIHCSNADQVARSANRFYAHERDLLLLHLDADRLGALLRDEPASNGELFPHVHGAIPPESVLQVQALQRGNEGMWLFES